jgi:hypothetical protein
VTTLMMVTTYNANVARDNSAGAAADSAAASMAGQIISIVFNAILLFVLASGDSDAAAPAWTSNPTAAPGSPDAEVPKSTSSV